MPYFNVICELFINADSEEEAIERGKVLAKETEMWYTVEEPEYAQQKKDVERDDNNPS